jgi:hypothetical protein
MAQNRKMVVIPHAGPIYPKGGIFGPITTPYAEEISTIGVLLMQGYKVAEVLSEGLLELDLSNFDKDNSAVNEAEKKRLAEQEAEKQRLVEQEAQRVQQVEAEEKRLAEEEAEKQHQAKQQAQQKQKQHQHQQKHQPKADALESK